MNMHSMKSILLAVLTWLAMGAPLEGIAQDMPLDTTAANFWVFDALSDSLAMDSVEFNVLLEELMDWEEEDEDDQNVATRFSLGAVMLSDVSALTPMWDKSVAPSTYTTSLGLMLSAFLD